MAFVLRTALPLSVLLVLVVLSLTFASDDEVGQQPALKSTPLTSSVSKLVGFHGTSLQVTLNHDLVYSLITEQNHQINALFSDAGGYNETTVMTQVGVMLPDGVTVTVEIDLAKYQELFQGRAPAAFPALDLPSLQAFLRVIICNDDYTKKLGTAHLITFDEGAGYMYFPSFDNVLQSAISSTVIPVLAARSPLMELVVWFEPGESAHLDLSIQLEPLAEKVSMHGLLGQTAQWAEGAVSALEGTVEDYVVPELLSTPAKNNLFTPNDEEIAIGSINSLGAATGSDGAQAKPALPRLPEKKLSDAQQTIQEKGVMVNAPVKGRSMKAMWMMDGSMDV